ncbi:MAG: hypothetical protein PHG65_04245, partial [Kiritimatiellae bacterium]|nr:hypothetical protein [Kiritimatiellia bacterium]
MITTSEGKVPGEWRGDGLHFVVFQRLQASSTSSVSSESAMSASLIFPGVSSNRFGHVIDHKQKRHPVRDAFFYLFANRRRLALVFARKDFFPI